MRIVVVYLKASGNIVSGYVEASSDPRPPRVEDVFPSPATCWVAGVAGRPLVQLAVAKTDVDVAVRVEQPSDLVSLADLDFGGLSMKMISNSNPDPRGVVLHPKWPTA